MFSCGGVGRRKKMKVRRREAHSFKEKVHKNVKQKAVKMNANLAKRKVIFL